MPIPEIQGMYVFPEYCFGSSGAVVDTTLYRLARLRGYGVIGTETPDSHTDLTWSPDGEGITNNVITSVSSSTSGMKDSGWVEVPTNSKGVGVVYPTGLNPGLLQSQTICFQK